MTPVQQQYLNDTLPRGQEGGIRRAHERMGLLGARQQLTMFGRTNDDRRHKQNVFWAGGRADEDVVDDPHPEAVALIGMPAPTPGSKYDSRVVGGRELVRGCR